MAQYDPWKIPNPEPGRWYEWANIGDQHGMGVLLSGEPGYPSFRIEGKATREEAIAHAESLGFANPDQWVDEKGRVRFGQNVLVSLPMAEKVRRDQVAQAAIDGQFQAQVDAHAAAMDQIPGARSVVMQHGEAKEREEWRQKRADNPRVSLSSKPLPA